LFFPQKRKKISLSKGLFYLFQKNKHTSYDHALRREKYTCINEFANFSFLKKNGGLSLAFKKKTKVICKGVLFFFSTNFVVILGFCQGQLDSF